MECAMESNCNKDKEIEHVCEIIKNKLYFMTIVTKKDIKNTSDNIYFCTDNELRYNSYYQDFGPLNISCLFKYCCKLTLYLENYATKRVIHYTICDPNKRVNAACLIGSYSIIYLGFLPRDIYNVLTCHVPPYRSFLDASQGGCSGFTIRLSDVFFAIYKAHLFGFFNFEDFDVVAYDYYNMLKNGDINWLLPRKFLAFIGPIDHGSILGLTPGVNCHSASFYVNYFLNNDIRTVIRLNNKLYDESVFKNAGIQHYDMYFSDGSTPPKEILIQFLRIVEHSKGAIAVHCKAGLGRTGSLIGAYIMKHYRMTAKETIGWLRLCRPGSVIGQQQAWLEKIERWLWRQGSRYSLEYFGEGDRIPHHRYGIYSLKWEEQLKRIARQFLIKTRTPVLVAAERKISSNLCRHPGRTSVIAPNLHYSTASNVNSQKPKPPGMNNKSRSTGHSPLPVRVKNSKSRYTKTSNARPEEFAVDNAIVCHKLDLNKYNEKIKNVHSRENRGLRHDGKKVKMVPNQKSQDNMTIIYVNPKKGVAMNTPTIFLYDCNRNQVPDKNDVSKPRSSSAYADYNAANKIQPKRAEKIYSKSANARQYQTEQHLASGSTTRKAGNHAEPPAKSEFMYKHREGREYRPMCNMAAANHQTQGDRLNEMKALHNTATITSQHVQLPDTVLYHCTAQRAPFAARHVKSMKVPSSGV